MAKTKALISFAVTAKLICVFVFAYAKSRFSHDAAHMMKAENLDVHRFYCIIYLVSIILYPDFQTSSLGDFFFNSWFTDPPTQIFAF